jgi:hypothetical protein
MKKAGIRNASLHTLRHTHASNLLSRGIPLPAVLQRLGHADANITARVYSHALPQDDARAADAWGEGVTRSYSVGFWHVMAHQIGRYALAKRCTRLKTKGKDW